MSTRRTERLRIFLCRDMRYLERITELIGGLQIVLSPFLIGLLFGSLIYFSIPTITTLIIGICIAFVGLFAGIIWATKKLKSKKGTVGFLSKIMSTPEFDKKED